MLERVAAILRSPAGRQIVSFAAIGVGSTIAYVVVYAALRAMMRAAAANALALAVTAVGNTALNRRVTFNVRGSAGLARDHLAGLVAFGLALAITSGSIALIGYAAPRAGRAVEIVVLVVANATATILRFIVLRRAIAAPEQITVLDSASVSAWRAR